MHQGQGAAACGEAAAASVKRWPAQPGAGEVLRWRKKREERRSLRLVLRWRKKREGRHRGEGVRKEKKRNGKKEGGSNDQVWLDSLRRIGWILCLESVGGQAREVCCVLAS